MELFYEESANYTDQYQKTKYNLLKAISIALYITAALWIFFAYNSLKVEIGALLIILIMFGPAAIIIFLGVIIGKRKNKYCNDYDYTLVSGSVRISKVISGKKRVHLYMFECSSIEKIGKITNSTFNVYKNMPDVEIKHLTPNDTPANDKQFYYFFCKVNSEKLVLVIECTELFIANVLKFSRRTILEKDN